MLFRSTFARAENIELGASGPMREALGLLVPAFERQSAHKVKTLLASDVEARAATRRGEDVDVAIIAGPFEDILASGGVLADTRRDLARAKLGLAVRGRDTKPDVSSMDALRRALLAAPRIAWPDPRGALAGVLFEACLDKLGVRDAIAAKSTRPRGGPATMVALPREEADVAIAFISEILPEPGVDLAGALPEECAPPATYAGFVLRGSKNADAGRALLGFLRGADAAKAYETAGMSPVK